MRKRAAAAFPAWRDTPPVERARLFFRYRQLIEENFDRICETVTREHGKTLAEARGSAYRGIENVEYACSVPTLLMGDTLEQLARGVDCETMNQPLGVCVGITPFNFPAMVPMWMFPLAVACGNTFVLKPSEKVPLTSNLIIELLGESRVSWGPKAFSTLFTGSRMRRRAFGAPEGEGHFLCRLFAGRETHLRKPGRDTWKARPGERRREGITSSLCRTPDVSRTVEALSTAAFTAARANAACRLASTAIAVGKAADHVLPSLIEAARAIKVGPTDVKTQPDMGPRSSRRNTATAC